MDVICHAKSGMGKTAVFVLAVLQQLEPVPGEVGALILCHTRTWPWGFPKSKHCLRTLFDVH